MEHWKKLAAARAIGRGADKTCHRKFIQLAYAQGLVAVAAAPELLQRFNLA